MSMHAYMPIPESGGEDAIGTSGSGVETGAEAQFVQLQPVF